MPRAMRFLALAGLVLSGLTVTPRAEAQQAALWDAIELRPLASGWTTSVRAVNDAGVSVGSSTSPPALPVPGSQGTRVPVKWDALGNPTSLALPAGCGGGEAVDIDEPGVILGEVYCNDRERLSVEWFPNGAVLELTDHVLPTAIDDNGISVGAVIHPQGSVPDWTAYAYWPPHARLDLPVPAGATRTVANDLTSWGYVVGATSYADRTPVATGWYGTTSFPLVSTDTMTEALAVNERGRALIQYFHPSSYSGAIVAPGGAVTPLNSDGINDFMVDLNAYDVVVGRRQLTQNTGLGPVYAAMFYAFGQAIQLDAIVPVADKDAFAFDDVAALNDRAWVVGTSPTKKVSWLLKPPG